MTPPGGLDEASHCPQPLFAEAAAKALRTDHVTSRIGREEFIDAAAAWLTR
jgi:hypothetical protein